MNGPDALRMFLQWSIPLGKVVYVLFKTWKPVKGKGTERGEKGWGKRERGRDERERREGSSNRTPTNKFDALTINYFCGRMQPSAPFKTSFSGLHMIRNTFLHLN